MEVELGPNRSLTARDAGADVVITATPRAAEGRGFLLGLFGLPAAGATVGAIIMASSHAPGMTLVIAVIAAVCWWLVLGLVRDRRRDRALDAEIAGRRLVLRAQDALVRGPGDREEVLALDAVVDHPLLYQRPAAFVALVRARQALVRAKPGSPRRLVLEAVAIEAAVLGGFAQPEVFVVLHASKIAAIVTDEAALDAEPMSWVYAVPTAVNADDMHYPVIDVARVIEWKQPVR